MLYFNWQDNEMNNHLKNSIVIFLFMFFLSSCSTTRMVTLTSVVRYPSTKNRICAISKMDINAPRKGQQVFTFEDIASFGISTTRVRAITPYKFVEEQKVIYVDSLHRADFQYYLSHDTDSMFNRALSNVFEIKNDSPLMANVETDFKYFLAKRGNIKNELGIHFWLKLSVMRDSVSVFSNTYETVHSEKYSNAMFTFPANSTLNSLFYFALRDIIEQIYTDNRLKEIQIT